MSIVFIDKHLRHNMEILAVPVNHVAHAEGKRLLCARKRREHEAKFHNFDFETEAFPTFSKGCNDR